jgi:hypothetical protein
MRGAQPATSTGARLFAGSPIPAPLPDSIPAREVENSIADRSISHTRNLNQIPN